MNFDKFLGSLPSLYENWGMSSAHPKSEKLQNLSKQLAGNTAANVMQLINHAVSCIEEDEVYCQIGCASGDSLIAALLGNTRMAYAIYATEPKKRDHEVEKLAEILSVFELEDQIFLSNESIEKFFFDLKEINTEDKIGVFFYNDFYSEGSNYRHLLLSLTLSIPFLADKALIILNEGKSSLVRQAMWDFIATHPQCKLLLDLPTESNGDDSFGNGLQILSWDSQSNYNYSWTEIQSKRDQQLAHTANIYVVCPEVKSPAGGVRQLYRHVDLLNKNGFSAMILHRSPGFRCTWFDNTTKIASSQIVEPGKSDYLVFPETSIFNIETFAPDVNKIIFNQNSYYSFSEYQADKYSLPIACMSKDVIAAFTVSEDNTRYLDHVFPDLNIYRLHYGIDSSVFCYEANKKKQICFMPRKNFGDALQIINILKYRDVLGEFEVVSIDNKTHAETAAILKESLIFLSFGYPEGFSLPPAEAMACGCIVIGYHGMGGKEYFKPEFSYPIEIGDIIGFAETIEKVLKECENDPMPLLLKGRKASEYVLHEYSLEREEADIVETWRKILKKEDNHLKHATVIHDFSEFSGLSVVEILGNINNHHVLSGEEWIDVDGEGFSEKAREFYKTSNYYIYDLLSVNYNKTAVVGKLNNFNPGIIQLIRQHPGKEFLEFGGGTGLFCELVFRFGKNVTYLDIPGLVSDFARWRFEKYQLPINCIYSNPDRLELDRSFDIIFSDAVFEHLIDPEQVMEELCDRTNPGGLMILLIDLSGHSEEYPMHADINISDLHQLIQTKGFENLTGVNSFCSIWQKYD
jgi:glycosyltransferase involved in cell wall biosynthesis/protein-L-isoaspartate O-methyltransferase